MAFCNACGTNLENGAKFCPTCGGVQSASNPVAVAPLATPPPPEANSGVKTVLIVVAAIVVMGMVGLAAVTFVGLRIAHHSRITNRDGNVRIESPLGNVESTTDPASVARDLGVDIYPGARVLTGNAANVTVGGMHTVAAEFETDDSSDKVAVFYKSKFPNPTVSTTNGGSTTIVSTDKQGLVTVTIEPEGSKTRIHVASVSGKGVTSGSGA
jgi:hypothetical protein